MPFHSPLFFWPCNWFPTVLPTKKPKKRVKVHFRHLVPSKISYRISHGATPNASVILRTVFILCNLPSSKIPYTFCLLQPILSANLTTVKSWWNIFSHSKRHQDHPLRTAFSHDQFSSYLYWEPVLFLIFWTLLLIFPIITCQQS